jgi:hypothetical protein
MRIVLAILLGLVTGLLAISFLFITLEIVSSAVLPNGVPPGMPIEPGFLICLTSIFFGGLPGYRVYEYIRGQRARPRPEEEKG